MLFIISIINLRILIYSLFTPFAELMIYLGEQKDLLKITVKIKYLQIKFTKNTYL